jgi:fibronectin type 3 domain-containing protein
MKKYTIIAVTLLNLISSLCTAQSKPVEYDEIKFLESEFSDQMVYVKWYSSGKSPAPSFATINYLGGNPVEVSTIKLMYSYHDTTFYVMQDTITARKSIESLQFPLQYFLIPHDTALTAGKPSEVALVSRKGNRWFTAVDAEKLDKQKGIKLTWAFTDPGMVKSFQILRSTSFDRNFEIIATIAPEKKEYDDFLIKPDVVYYYQIFALLVDGNRPIVSNTVFSAGFNPQAPLAPVILSALPVRGGAVIKVKAIDSETAGIRIYRNDGMASKMDVISDLMKVPDSMTVIYYDTSRVLSGRKNYTYGAKAESSSFVESSLSTTVYVRPLIKEAPSSPLSFKVYSEDGKVRLFWDNMEETDPGIAGYQILRKEENLAGSDQPAGSSVNPGTSGLKGQNSASQKSERYTLLHPENAILKVNYFTDSTVLAGKAYTFMIKAVDIDGNISPDGSIATVIIPERKPIEPFGLSGFMSDQGVYLNWGQAIYPEIASVNLYRYQRGKTPVLVKSFTPEVLEYLDAEVKSGLNFYYLTTVNKAGAESDRSEEVGVE